jgi:hypothetical protein
MHQDEITAELTTKKFLPRLETFFSSSGGARRNKVRALADIRIVEQEEEKILRRWRPGSNTQAPRNQIMPFQSQKLRSMQITAQYQSQTQLSPDRRHTPHAPDDSLKAVNAAAPPTALDTKANNKNNVNYMHEILNPYTRICLAETK